MGRERRGREHHQLRVDAAHAEHRGDQHRSRPELVGGTELQTDYLPLNRMAGKAQVERIKVNTLNPDAETKTATDARMAREKAAATPRASAAIRPIKALAPVAPPQPAQRCNRRRQPRQPAQPAPPAQGAPGAAQPGQQQRQQGQAGQDSRQSDRPDSGSNGAPQGGQGQRVACAGQGRRRSQIKRRRANRTSCSCRHRGVGRGHACPRGTPAGETLVDLGCGDGRIVVAAAQRYGCRAIGYDIDPQRVKEARARITAAGWGRVRVEQRDLFSLDLEARRHRYAVSAAAAQRQTDPAVADLHAGARVVSHDFAIAGVVPIGSSRTTLPRLGLYKTYFLFTAPLRLQPAAVRHEWAESTRLPWEAAGAPAA